MAAWWADISHQPLVSLSSFGFAALFWPVLAWVYIAIHKTAGRCIYAGLLVLQYALLACWVISISSGNGQALPTDHYMVGVLFVGYAIAQVIAWRAFYRGVSKPKKA